MNLAKTVRQDGYVVVPGLLSNAEVRSAKRSLTEHFHRAGRIEGLGLHQPDAGVAIPSISWLIAHPAIKQAFSEIMATTDCFFTGNCDAHQNMLSWWHKDTGNATHGWFPTDFFFAEDGVLFRAGIYLQDHYDRKTGLTVRKGSHRHHSKETGAATYVPTRAGDVIFFDMRLTHAGQMADPLENLLLWLSRRQPLKSLAVQLKTVYWRAAGKPPKHSVFFTYGKDSQVTANFMKFELLQRRIRSPELSK